MLIEAGLAAVAMAIGLVAISRGLGSSLSALSSLQRRDLFLSVASSTLQQLSTEAQQAPPLPNARRHGACPDIGMDCEWELTSESFDPPELDAPTGALRLVTLSVRRTQGPPARISLRAVWPTEWVAD